MKYATHWITAFITLAVLSFAGWQDPYVKQLVRLKSFDIVQQYDTPVISEDIAFVEIDERAIEEYGQWPWKRDVLADAIGKLREAGAGIIVLPILFSEEDRLGGDDALVSQLFQNGVVVAQVGTTQANKNAVPRGVAKIGDPLPWLFEWPGMLGPIPDIGESADGVGVLNAGSEIDGVTRRLPLLMRVGDDVYPAMAIEVIRVATGDPSYQVKTQEGGITAMRVPGYATIQTDANAQIWLRWNKQFPAISIVDEHLYPALQGKTIIIGSTAEGIGSVIATPNGEKYAHMLIGTSLQTIINADNIVRYDFATFIEWAAALVIGAIVIVLAILAPYWLVGAIIVLVPISAVYGAYYAFITHTQLWDWSWVVLVTTIVGFHAVFNRFTREFFEKQAIKKQFAGYCSPTVVRMLQENPALIKDGMKRDISICFSDLRGFTPLGESFGDDVKGLTKLMNGYMDSITQPVLDADGMIIKYIGDASMHVHNAPNDDPDHPKSAVRTGLMMLRAVEKFNEKIILEGRPPIGMGAGINSGLGYLGEMGSTSRHSYDVLGDAVSTAARIESKCKEYGCLLLVGGATVEQCGDEFFFLKIDDLAVKGKSVGIPIYTVIEHHCDKEQKAQHDTMHELYRNQKFDDAIHQCVELKGAFGGQLDAYYDMWIERCEFQKTQDLPKDWNGVFIATTK